MAKPPLPRGRHAHQHLNATHPPPHQPSTPNAPAEAAGKEASAPPSLCPPMRRLRSLARRPKLTHPVGTPRRLEHAFDGGAGGDRGGALRRLRLRSEERRVG